MSTPNISHKEKTIFFLFLALIIFLFYSQSLNNFFFSDDFEWLVMGRKIECRVNSIFTLHGRDFNPIVNLYFFLSIKLFGFKVVVWRIAQLLFIYLNSLLFFKLLEEFSINFYTAALLSSLLALSPYVSEVALNISAVSYVLAVFFFLSALKLRNFPGFFLLFSLLSILSKEVIFLAFIPATLILHKKKKDKVLTLSFLTVVLTIRTLIQLSSASEYTSFISKDNLLQKFHLIILKAFQIYPYNKPFFVSAFLFILLLLSFFKLKKEKLLSFSFLSLLFYTLFLMLFPKLSSRYFYIPTIFSLSLIAFYIDFIGRLKGEIYSKYISLFLAAVFFLSFYPMVNLEIKDYKKLGDFSKQCLKRAKLNTRKTKNGFTINEEGALELIKLYKDISKKGGLPKLLPLREEAYCSLIKYNDLIWLLNEKTCFKIKKILKKGQYINFFVSPSL